MRYNLETVNPSNIYADVELVIKFDCHDRWVFKTMDGEYIVLQTTDIRRLEPRKKVNSVILDAMKNGVIEVVMNENTLEVKYE